MSNKYEMLLSPIQIRGKTLKSRMLSSKCALQNFTMEQAIEFYTGLAKNGAATVIVAMGNHPERDLNETPNPFSAMAGTAQDMRDPETREGFRRLAEAVHAEGTLISASMMDIEPLDVNISDTPNWDEIPKKGDYNSAFFHNKPGISKQRLEKLIDEFVFRAKEAKELGFDMCSFYMSYRSSILACSMSPLLNQRTGDGEFCADAQARSRIERLAMDAVWAVEVKRGNIPIDVSAEKCGWDITSRAPMQDDHRQAPDLHIEVKGRVKGSTTVTVSRNEVLTAINQADKFILAVCLIDGDTVDGPYYVRRPFEREMEHNVVSQNYDLASLLEKSEKMS